MTTLYSNLSFADQLGQFSVQFIRPFTPNETVNPSLDSNLTQIKTKIVWARGDIVNGTISDLADSSNGVADIDLRL